MQAPVEPSAPKGEQQSKMDLFAGAIGEVDAGTASRWLAAGWVESIKAERAGKAASRSRRPKR